MSLGFNLYYVKEMIMLEGKFICLMIGAILGVLLMISSVTNSTVDASFLNGSVSSTIIMKSLYQFCSFTYPENSTTF